MTPNQEKNQSLGKPKNSGDDGINRVTLKQYMNRKKR